MHYSLMGKMRLSFIEVLFRTGLNVDYISTGIYEFYINRYKRWAAFYLWLDPQGIERDEICMVLFSSIVQDVLIVISVISDMEYFVHLLKTNSSSILHVIWDIIYINLLAYTLFHSHMVRETMLFTFGLYLIFMLVFLLVLFRMSGSW